MNEIRSTQQLQHTHKSIHNPKFGQDLFVKNIWEVFELHKQLSFISHIRAIFHILMAIIASIYTVITKFLKIMTSYHLVVKKINQYFFHFSPIHNTLTVGSSQSLVNNATTLYIYFWVIFIFFFFFSIPEY